MAVAPAYASNFASGKAWHVVADQKEGIFTGTVGASDTYATGGFAISPSTFGLQTITDVDPIVFSTGHWGNYVAGNVVVFSAAGTELANTSAALQSATFRIRVLGK